MAINSISNSILLVKNHLISISAITDIVEDRVYSHHFYDFDSETTPMPILIIDYEGGKSNYGMENQRITLNVYCYSKSSSSEATRLYDAVYQNLHAARLSNNTLAVKGYAYEISRPDSGYNSSIRAWFAISKFTLNLAG